MSGSFLEFAELCDALAATTKKLEKRALIAGWLKTLSVEDAARGSLYLAGQAFAETDPRVLNLGWRDSEQSAGADFRRERDGDA